MKLDELTKDAQYLLSQMYTDYLKSRSKGQSKRDSMDFGSESDIHDNVMPEWSQSDVRETINELSRKGLLNVMYGSNKALRISMSTNAIVLMEHKFNDKVDEVLDYATKIKALIPFI